MKPLYQTAEQNTVKGLIEMLGEYTLDPTFLNYGEFIRKVEYHQYSPKVRNQEWLVNNVEKGMYHVSGNFFDVSWAFHFDVSAEDAKVLIEAIEAHKNTDRFKKALREKFNAITFERTVYFDECLPNGFGHDKWWITKTGVEYLMPIDTPIEEVDKLLESLKEEPKDDGRVVQHSIKYTEKHFRNDEEAEEFWNTLTKKFEKGFGKHMVRRADTVKNLKDYKFETTGRKMKVHLSASGSIYKEVDPIIDKIYKL